MAVGARGKRSRVSRNSEAEEVKLSDAKPAAAGGPSSNATLPLPVAQADKAASGGILLNLLGSPIEAHSLIFDPDWYKAEYEDVAAAKLDPVIHYFDNGFREGRNPNRYFDTNWYASNNPDVAAAGLNPFLHYVLYGAREGRKPAPQ